MNVVTLCGLGSQKGRENQLKGGEGERNWTRHSERDKGRRKGVVLVFFFVFFLD